MMKTKRTIKKLFSIVIVFFMLLSSTTSYVEATSTTFSYTGTQQTWVVPAGVTSVYVDAYGASGGGTAPGLGGRVRTTITTTPGETLYIYVGGQGAVGSGGYNGGGAGSGSRPRGGGATDVRQGGTANANRVVVAGGGGGSGVDGASYGAGAGGDGGGTTANSGTDGTLNGGLKGSPGTASAGGSGGLVRSGSYGTQYGGGGGGGYYGGGGGSANTAGTGGSLGSGGAGGTSGGTVAYGGGGGGGGSSYSSGTNTTHTKGVRSGNGILTISWGSGPNTPSLDLPANGATAVSTTPILKTTATDQDSDDLQYKIELCTDLAMTTNCQTFDQSSSQTGWSGQNAQTNTHYSSGTQGVYTVQSALSTNTTYYWRSYSYDSTIATWSSTQGSAISFTTIGAYCSAPRSGDLTVSSSCIFENDIDGVDAGTGNTNTAKIYLNSGTLTIDSTQTIGFGSLVLGGGNLFLLGSMRPGSALFVDDADGDGFPSSSLTTQYIGSGVNRARRGLSVDYNDSSNTVYPGTTCNGGCSINNADGTCSAVAAGENSLAACSRCDGSSLATAYIANGSTDTEGNNLCNSTHFVCNGTGTCSAPTTTTCQQRTAAPSQATCTAKCTSISNGIDCVSGYSNSGCTTSASACGNASTYCKCNIYQY